MACEHDAHRTPAWGSCQKGQLSCVQLLLAVPGTRDIDRDQAAVRARRRVAGQIPGSLRGVSPRCANDPSAAGAPGNHADERAEARINRDGFGLTWKSDGLASKTSTITIHVVFTRR